MVRHFFFDKINTIVRGSMVNRGLNPVAELNYGANVTRFISHFNVSQISDLFVNKECCDWNKTKITINMTNCTSINGIPYEKTLAFGNGSKTRTSSFSIIAFALPQEFDEGRGFEVENETVARGTKSYSEEGSNWFCSKSGVKWPENGVYTNDTLSIEYSKYLSGETSIVIGEQHFDFGDEMLCIDITDYIKDIIVSNKPFYGIGFAFMPSLERMETSEQQYVGFFGDHTNTFFHPYVELVYNDAIRDDRNNFCLGRINRLYFYSSFEGEMKNLDEIPVCKIDDNEYPVKQSGKGVYYAEVSLSCEPNTIQYDVWSNIKIDGINLGDVELEFAVNPKERVMSMGLKPHSGLSVVPTLYGIYEDENVSCDETRLINVKYRKKFTTTEDMQGVDAQFRLYSKDGNKEIDVLPYNDINRGFLENNFTIFGGDLIPGRYFVDVKTFEKNGVHYHKNILQFNIISNVTKRYC